MNMRNVKIFKKLSFNIINIQSLPTQFFAWCVNSRGVSGTGFGNDTSVLKIYFVLPKNGSKHYLKYTFLAFPMLRILGLGTPLFNSRKCIM